MVAACIASAAEAVRLRCDALEQAEERSQRTSVFPAPFSREAMRKHKKTPYGGYYREHGRPPESFPDKKRRVCKKCGVVYDWKVEGWNALMGRPEAHLVRNWQNRFCRRCNILRYYQKPVYASPDAWKIQRFAQPAWQQYVEHFQQYDLYKG